MANAGDSSHASAEPSHEATGPSPRTQGRVVTRFAPSPTGMLHVGGARTALFNWALARRFGGTFILRIEDTDAARSTPAAVRAILAALRWLGLNWDQGPPSPETWEEAIATSFDPYAASEGGAARGGGRDAAGPYFQSRRGDLYRGYLERLRKTGRVYDDGEGGGALRFRMPDHAMGLVDEVLGEVRAQPGQPQMRDFVIFKSATDGAPGDSGKPAGGAGGGGPTFHFANVVDDVEMGVTHVIRGQEHLNNTIKHLALLEALELKPPRYAHIPLIFNADGSKMSKRDKAKTARRAATQHLEQAGDAEAWLARLREVDEDAGQWFDPPPPAIQEDEIRGFLDKQNDSIRVAKLIAHELEIALPEIDVADFHESGYLPAALVNYLALLGWNPGGDVERFGPDPLAFLSEHFRLDRVHKAPARFDRGKLIEFNRQRIAERSVEDFKQAIWNQPNDAGDKLRTAYSGDDDPRLDWLARATQARSRTLRDPIEHNRYLFIDAWQLEEDPKAVKKNLTRKADASGRGEGLRMLEAVRDDLAAIPEEQWTPRRVQAVLEDFTARHELKNMGKIAQPLRVAVSGSSVTPPIDLTLAILGRTQTLERLEWVLSRHEPEPVGRGESQTS